MNRSSINTGTLLQCIRRDPESWNGVSLLYLRTAKKELDAALAMHAKNRTDILTLNGKSGECVLLGTKLADNRPAGAHAYCWIHNITDDWRQACAILTAMLKNDEEAPAYNLKAHGKFSILIVEDDPMTSKLVSKHLQKFGEVTTTKNAREATANNIVRNPDIIFLDIHYKDDIYDGFDVLTNILSTNSEAFVVMFSANRDPATILKALSLGAQGFIAKPFHASDFLHYLAKLASVRE